MKPAPPVESKPMKPLHPKASRIGRRPVTLWLGEDVIAKADAMAALNYSRSAAVDAILRAYFQQEKTQ